VIARLQQLGYQSLHRLNVRNLDACGEDSVVSARIVRHAVGGRIEIGRYCHIRGRLITWLPDSRLTIGDNCIIQARTAIECMGSVTIGSDALIGFDILISDGRGHSVEWADRVQDQLIYRTPHAINMQTMSNQPVAIGQGCWIGARTIILPGVTIGDGCTIGAGSVVTKSIPDFSIAAGNPARVVRDLPHRRPAGHVDVIAGERS
jgi:acetyltransferase-like isoleucine patch superfamily enzyme